MAALNPSPVTKTERPLVDWSVASRPIAGQTVSGDLHLVKPCGPGVLLAAIDGVGHGDEATAAARVAANILERDAGKSVITLVKECHEALLNTRGVVMTLAMLNAVDDTVTWLGVGNVEGRLLRADASAVPPSEHVLLRGGMIGYQLPALHASVFPVSPGDLLIFATDGLHSGFSSAINHIEPPKLMAARILVQYFKGTDDALVLVARYLGRGA